jgi:hypothetical protein
LANDNEAWYEALKRLNPKMHFPPAQTYRYDGGPVENLYTKALREKLAARVSSIDWPSVFASITWRRVDRTTEVEPEAEGPNEPD